MKNMVWGNQDFVLSQGFGPSTNTLEPALFGYPHFHKGADFLMPIGTPLYCDEDGICNNATDQYGAHYQFIIHADNTTTLYVHLNDFVASGQVKKGQLISHSGDTGLGHIAHLHFEYRSDKNNINSCIDPLPHLNSLGGDTMIDPKYYANGELFKYSDSPDIYWKIPSNQAYNENIGDQSKLVDIGLNPVPTLNAQLETINKQVANLQEEVKTDQATIDTQTKQIADLKAQIVAGGGTAPPDPIAADTRSLIQKIKDWFTKYILN